MAQVRVTISDRKPKQQKKSEAMKGNKNGFKKGNQWAVKPGECRNPGGRPKGSGTKQISKAYSAYLEQLIPESERVKLDLPEGSTWADAIAVRVLHRSLGLIDGDKICFTGIQELREVTEGKLPEKNEFTGKDGAPLPANSVPPQLIVRFRDPADKEITPDGEHSNADESSSPTENEQQEA